jgi:hypothetical protein
VSCDSLVERHVDEVLDENAAESEKNRRQRRLEPAYKQHAAVDDKLGVILDVEATGQTYEWDIIESQVVARPGSRHKTRPRKHEDPSLSDRSGRQPQAAGGGSLPICLS